METKSFHIGDVLSILTDTLVTHDHIQGVYNILDWMTGESLMTHQLHEAAVAARPVLMKTFPALAEVKFPKGLQHVDAIFTWVDTQGELYGEWFDVPKIPEEDYRLEGLRKGDDIWLNEPGVLHMNGKGELV